MREGMPLPQSIQNAPELWFGLELYLNAFFDLNTERSSGMGVGPIPWSAIDRYAERHGFDDEQRTDLQYHIRALDATYIEHHNKKSGDK